MIYNLTFSVVATSAGTWINTFLIDTRFLQWAIGHTDTFRATEWRIAKIAGQTRANRLILLRITLTVRTTRRRHAFIFIASRQCFCDRYAGGVRIPCVTPWTAAYGIMIQSITSGQWAASADAGIDTFAANTRAISLTFRIQNTFGTTTN